MLLIAIIITAIILIRNTLARYETNATSQKDVDVAFWIFDNDLKSGRILLQDVYPSDVSFDYTFTVSNFKDTKKAETDLSYDIVLTTTTNLPLEYDIEKDGVTCIKTEQLITDEDGTFYKEVKIEGLSNNMIMRQGTDTTNTFVLKVKFPKSSNAGEEFADLVEHAKIEVNAKQLIE